MEKEGERQEDRPAKEGELPQKYWIYKKPFEMLYATRRLFRKLLADFGVCLKCIFRIYSVEHPRMYNDPELYLELLPGLLGKEWEQLMGDYDLMQCCMNKLCWMCEGVFQQKYLHDTVSEVKDLIAQKGFEDYPQFKLNIRIPNIILLRNIVLTRYIYHGLTQEEGISKDELNLYYSVLVLPWENSQFIDPKTILKWILANVLNSATSMTSTADDHPNNLIITVEQEHADHLSEAIVVSHFRSSLGLEKKKEKVKYRKRCIQVEKEGKDDKQDYRCSSSNMAKIVKMKTH